MQDKVKVEKWHITKLKEHPQHAAVFGEASEEEVVALADSIKQYGLRTQIGRAHV